MRFGQTAFTGKKIREDFSFTYAAPINPGADPCPVRIDFNAEDKKPGRIAAVIGRNATGKTNFLSMLAEDLVQISRASRERLETRDKRFKPSRPIFTRVVAISYGAFDRFRKPLNDHDSYVYCGIRTEKGGLSLSHLKQSLENNMARVKMLGRSAEWEDAITSIFSYEDSEAFMPVTMKEFKDSKEPTVNLSSGQSILVHCLTAILAWIEDDSLILFDEPETHLHPNAVASLLWILSRALNKHKSFALVATHSPIVIQQIPGQRVVVFDRSSGVTIARKLEVESFGESISNLTHHVFETNDSQSLFKSAMRRLSKEMSFDEVISLFDDNLSMSATSFLLAQYEVHDV
jgi:ABC-type multidrug transport system ATPase subunit